MAQNGQNWEIHGVYPQIPFLAKMTDFTIENSPVKLKFVKIMHF
jgi:hypothetical protein